MNGQEATCTAAFQATHTLANPHGCPLWRLGGDYSFRLVRKRDDQWRIAAVVMTVRWADGNQHLLTLAKARGER